MRVPASFLVFGAGSGSWLSRRSECSPTPRGGWLGGDGDHQTRCSDHSGEVRGEARSARSSGGLRPGRFALVQLSPEQPGAGKKAMDQMKLSTTRSRMLTVAG